MTQTNLKLLTRLSDKKALIVKDERGGCATYAAYPAGDRRRRPISWISKDVFEIWLARGFIRPRGKGWEPVKGAAANPRAVHRTMETATLSGADGVFRPAQINLNTRSALRVLGLRRDRDGETFLTPSELEAGERFANDYARAAYEAAPTQDYARAGNDAMRVNTAENAAIGAIDSRARVNAAIDYVGPGLSRAVISICGKDMGLEQMEKIEGWTRRSGRTVLKLALQRLSDFYGTKPGVPPAARSDYPARARASF